MSSGPRLSFSPRQIFRDFGTLINIVVLKGQMPN